MYFSIQLPVILTGSDLVQSAYKWDFDYLQRNLGPGPFTVFSNSSSPEVTSTSEQPSSGADKPLIKKKKPKKNTQKSTSSESQTESPNSSNASNNHNPPRTRKRHNYFKYYDEKKVEVYKGEFTFDIKRMEISFDEFLEKFKGNRYTKVLINSSIRFLFSFEIQY